MTTSTAEHQRAAPARVPITVVEAEHKPAIVRHLLALNESDRYLRFGYMASDEQIRKYVDGIRFGCDDVFGIFNRHLDLIAMAHLSYAVGQDRTNSAEFGVSVSTHARGRGYGNQLFDRAVVHARNNGVSVLCIHALSENAAMLSIARKAGASIVRDGTESEAYLALPPADFSTQVAELLEDQVGQANYQIKARLQQVRGWLRSCWQRWRRPGG